MQSLQRIQEEGGIEKSGEWVWEVNGWYIAHGPRTPLSHLCASIRPLAFLFQSTYNF